MAEVGVNLSGEGFRTALASDHIETYADGGVRGGKTKFGAAKAKSISDWHAFLGDRAPCDCPLAQGADKKVSPCPVCGAVWGMLGWLVAPTYELTHQGMTYIREMADRSAACRVVRWNAPGTGQWTLVWDQMTTVGKVMQVTVETKTGEDPDGLASVAPDWVWVDEAGACPPVVRDRVMERASEKGAPIFYTGTLENDEQKEQFAWFIENSKTALYDPSPSIGAYSLPSWDNVELYGSCLSVIKNNPLYAEWCPDAEHGEGHSRLNHPVMRRLKNELPDEEFRRRYGGEPVGLQWRIYNYDFDSMVEDVPAGVRWIDKGGGLDYGSVHPSTLAACTLEFDPRDEMLGKEAPRGILWVHEVWINESKDPGDTFRLKQAQTNLSLKYGIRKWSADPNEKFLAKNDPMTENVSGSDGSRNYRINLLKTRFGMGKIKFVRGGAGIEELIWELKNFHRYKTRAGKMEIKRDKDDRLASVENVGEMFDGIRPRSIPKPKTISTGSSRHRRSYGKQRRV